MSRFGFVEIPTKNLDESVEFYSGLFGWTFNVLPNGRYAFFKTQSTVHGGLSADDEPGQGVVVYIETPDIEQTLRQVENLGGKTVVAKTLIMPEEGYYGRFSDPSGNVLGLWSKT